MKYRVKPKVLGGISSFGNILKNAPGNIFNFGKTALGKSRDIFNTVRSGSLMGDIMASISKTPKANKRLESLLLREKLFHGNRSGVLTDDFGNEIDRFVPKTLDHSAHNWFGGSFFTTASKSLAQTYGNVFKVRGSKGAGADARILDLTSGAPTMDRQFPGIVDFIANNLSQGNMLSEAEKFTGLIKPPDILKYLQSDTRHLAIAGDPNFRRVAERFGIDALRHTSGQGAGLGATPKDMIDDVFAFFNPRGIEAIIDQVKRANGGMVGKYNMGGMVVPKYFAKGGMVGRYKKGGDVIPAMLNPREFVMNPTAVKQYGAGTMEAINNGTFAAGGAKNNIANNGTNTANSVYNSYSVNVNLSGDSGNPQDIARTVIKEIKRLDAQRVRGV
jgi:hypothetical protein